MKKLIGFLSIVILMGCEKASESAAFVGGTGQGGSMARFTIMGDYLYTVDKENLKVFDITNAALPVFKRSVPVGFEIETIFPFKDKLFIGSTSMVHIFSIADPANPQKLSEAISPEVMRRCDPVVAKDSVAFATLRTNSECGGTQSILAVYDIKNVLHPVQRGTAFMLEPYGLGYSDNTLYVCDGIEGLVIFDISNPFSPNRVGALASSANSRYIDVIPYGDILVCWVSDGMVLYNITDKQNPVLIKKIS
ncbi:MAG: LVIVD repeat-containing protein [Flavisolibacter sp.]